MSSLTKKIEVQSGCTNYNSYKNYTMIVAIANYSANEVCKAEARRYINADLSTRVRIGQFTGGFMSAVYYGTFADAWNKADGSNRAALLEALSKNEIEV